MRPTKKEIKAYFENALTVKCLDDNDAYCLDFSQDIEFYTDSIRLLNQKDEPYSGQNTYCELWNDCKGYAKILTYKNNDMKLSKEFIKANADKTLKEVFPEICVHVLEVGKWYKSQKGAIVFCEDTDDKELIYGYGFTSCGIWYESNKKPFQSNRWREATNEEIFEALKNQCDKLGFKNGVYVDSLCEQEIGIIDLEFKTTYKADKNEFWRGGYCLFKDGKWATIIETITKSEAEKQLNKKIV